MLEESCRGTILAHQMLSEGDRVVVALSGGPDSVSLLHFLHKAAPSFGISLSAVHVNHMLRGSQSEDDAIFCERLCDALHLPIAVRRLDVHALMQKTRSGTQEAARIGRYNILVDEAVRFKANKIAVGQNLDDQAETVLFRLLRGTGPDGIAGIWPKRSFRSESGLGPVEVIRPLLGTMRSEIMEYIERQGLSYRTDPTNFKPVYSRNSIRLEVMPMLREINSEVERAIARFADLAHQQNQLLSELARPIENLVQPTGSGSRFETAKVQELSQAAQRYVIRKAFLMANYDLSQYSHEHVESVRKVVAGLSSATQVPQLRVESRSGFVYFEPEKAAEEEFGWEPVRLNVPGETLIAKLNVKVSARIQDDSELSVDPRANTDVLRAFIDFDKVHEPVTIRKRNRGDVFYPLGMAGTKKIKDFLISKRIDRKERDRVPIFEDARGDIVWVGGIQIDDRFKVLSTTRRYLVLSIEPTV